MHGSRAKVITSISDGDPLVFQDPESGVSLIVPKRKTSGFRVFRFPECEKCLMPAYLPTPSEFPQSVALLMTVTEQGTIQQIVVANSTGARATEKTLAAVQSWHFKPAIDSSGNPFAARILINVNLTKPLFPPGLPESGDPPKIYRGPNIGGVPQPPVTY
jgi:TonB family protein